MRSCLIFVVQLLISFQNKSWRIPSYDELEDGWVDLRPHIVNPYLPRLPEVFPGDNEEDSEDHDPGYLSDGGDGATGGLSRHSRPSSPELRQMLDASTYSDEYDDFSDHYNSGSDFPAILNSNSNPNSDSEDSTGVQSGVVEEDITMMDLSTVPGSPCGSSSSSEPNFDEDSAYVEAVLKRDLPEAVWE